MSVSVRVTVTSNGSFIHETCDVRTGHDIKCLNYRAPAAEAASDANGELSVFDLLDSQGASQLHLSILYFNTKQHCMAAYVMMTCSIERVPRHTHTQTIAMYICRNVSVVASCLPYPIAVPQSVCSLHTRTHARRRDTSVRDVPSCERLSLSRMLTVPQTSVCYFIWTQ